MVRYRTLGWPLYPEPAGPHYLWRSESGVLPGGAEARAFLRPWKGDDGYSLVIVASLPDDTMLAVERIDVVTVDGHNACVRFDRDGVWYDDRAAGDKELLGLLRRVQNMLSAGGRPSSRDARLQDYRRAVIALRDDYPQPTQAQMLEYLGMHDTDERQVRRDIEPLSWEEWLDTVV